MSCNQNKFCFWKQYSVSEEICQIYSEQQKLQDSCPIRIKLEVKSLFQ